MVLRKAGKSLLTNRKEQDEDIKRKKALLQILASKVTGPSIHEIRLPIAYTSSCSDHIHTKAVLLVTSDIEIHGIKLTRSAVHLLPRASNITVDSLSHWALCVVDRGPGDGQSWCYDLVSDQIILNMLGKSYARAYPVTEEMVTAWNSCSYMGETTHSHDEIKGLAEEHISRRPRYNLLNNNCQHLAEELVRTLCEGRIVSQANLGVAFDSAQEKLVTLFKTPELERLRKESKSRTLSPPGPERSQNAMITGDVGGVHGQGAVEKKSLFGLRVPSAVDLDRIRPKKSRRSFQEDR